jgi:hypothetical protein
MLRQTAQHPFHARAFEDDPRPGSVPPAPGEPVLPEAPPVAPPPEVQEPVPRPGPVPRPPIVPGTGWRHPAVVPIDQTRLVA